MDISTPETEVPTAAKEVLPMDTEAKLAFCKKWIKKLNRDWATMEMHREEAVRYFNSDPAIVTLIDGRSQVTTTDFQDAIETAKPDILETLAGGDDPVNMDPQTGEDVRPVKNLETLVNNSVRRKNPWYRIVNDFLDDSMKLKLGVIKYQWLETEEHIDRDYEDLTDEEITAKLRTPGVSVLNDHTEVLQAAVMGDMLDPMTGQPQIISPETTKRDTTLRYTVSDEYVALDTISAADVKFPLDTKSFEDPEFLFQEVRLPKWKFIQQYTSENFDRVKEIADDLSASNTSYKYEQFADLGGISFIMDADKTQYKAYECYFRDENTGEPRIFCFSGDDIIHIDVQNKYKKPPFRGGSPFLMSHRLIGLGYLDILREIQKERTFFKRQIMDNLAQANYRRYFGDPERMNLDDYLNNNSTNALIRVTGDPSTVVMPESKAQLPPELFQVWEIMQIEKDYHIPTPRSYTGTNPNSLNRTFRGQNQQISQSSKRINMMIRGYCEDVFAPLFSDVVDCYLRFMQKSVTVRYLNEDIECTPDNIIGKYDMVINVGLGNNDKSDLIAKLQQILALAGQLKANGASVVTAQNIYNLFKELVKAMGFKNTSDYATDPRLTEISMGMIQMIMGLLSQLQAIPQIQPAVAQIAPQIYGVVQQFCAALGVPPPPPPQPPQAPPPVFPGGPRAVPPAGGMNPGATFPGQNMHEQPMQAAQPMQPRMTPDGGQFHG